VAPHMLIEVPFADVRSAAALAHERPLSGMNSLVDSVGESLSESARAALERTGDLFAGVLVFFISQLKGIRECESEREV